MFDQLLDPGFDREGIFVVVLMLVRTMCHLAFPSCLGDTARTCSSGRFGIRELQSLNNAGLQGHLGGEFPLESHEPLKLLEQPVFLEGVGFVSGHQRPDGLQLSVGQYLDEVLPGVESVGADVLLVELDLDVDSQVLRVAVVEVGFDFAISELAVANVQSMLLPCV